MGGRGDKSVGAPTESYPGYREKVAAEAGAATREDRLDLDNKYTVEMNARAVELVGTVRVKSYHGDRGFSDDGKVNLLVSTVLLLKAGVKTDVARRPFTFGHLRSYDGALSRMVTRRLRTGQRTFFKAILSSHTIFTSERNMVSDILDRPAPIFKKFTVKGLNGYKDVSLACHSPVKIVSADNGSGKTSLLNALYAIFEGRASLLYSLDFESIEIVWANDAVSAYRKVELFGELRQEDLESMAEDRLFSQWDVNKRDAIDLLTKYIVGDMEEVIQSEAYKEIYRHSPFDRDDILERLSSICAPLLETGRYPELFAAAKIHLNGCSVLYLPTYRRIEADIPEYRSTSAPPVAFRSKGRVSKDLWNSSRLIFFGMQDVEAKLNSILSQIRKETLEASTRSNGQTLEQLIDADPTRDATLQESFDLSSIEVVLARVGKNTAELRAGLSALIKSGEIYKENRGELRRFLSQLLKVYALRREDEEAIERFTNIVNRYLYPEGENPLLPVKSEKQLTFDKVRLEMQVKNLMTKKEIKFGNLSSGEKQVVSIFARLMLDPRKNYLVLVDEPELSLSLEWQQMLLPDVCSAPNFRQIVAITHSPFIFDNALALAAGSLETTYRNVEA